MKNIIKIFVRLRNIMITIEVLRILKTKLEPKIYQQIEKNHQNALTLLENKKYASIIAMAIISSKMITSIDVIDKCQTILESEEPTYDIKATLLILYSETKQKKLNDYIDYVVSEITTLNVENLTLIEMMLNLDSKNAKLLIKAAMIIYYSGNNIVEACRILEPATELCRGRRPAT